MVYLNPINRSKYESLIYLANQNARYRNVNKLRITCTTWKANRQDKTCKNVDPFCSNQRNQENFLKIVGEGKKDLEPLASLQTKYINNGTLVW